MHRPALRWIVLTLAALAAVPVLLLALYTVVAPVSTLMLARWATGQPVVRIMTPIAAIDPQLIKAVIASEDTGFCRHHGVDWGELKEVIDDADGDAPRRGASTITMQVAKNLLLWPGRSYVRKALEIPLALVIDAVWSKRQILQTYLNIAEWGPAGEFGAEAGAQRAFGKSAANLSRSEAALLAVMLPNPHRRNAARPGPGLRRVAGTVSRRAAALPDLANCIRR
ncbi:transglycosylase domain-containing protein [Blastochloris viridis]|uniref:Biosynthetic peptidoglycan transglycosylase n=1 Tax=Blastochloris viridis TaxID=1079 RepID=A0A0H5BEG0_BLAVI|nr:transglycosylase domain-containing protein [Blastochloris viridis]ALK08003.1 Penicillin-binding protein 2D [Blastochloris viridis]BAR98741.1 monofunctional biosynthetic peptidoglycan transglycosylase [Blastochloris viridis]CUU43925.1 Penicillin-binding protein 1A [Blastochloris viridis]